MCLTFRELERNTSAPTFLHNILSSGAKVAALFKNKFHELANVVIDPNLNFPQTNCIGRSPDTFLSSLVVIFGEDMNEARITSAA